MLSSTATYVKLLNYYGPVSSSDFNGNWYQEVSGGTSVAYPSTVSTLRLFLTQTSTMTTSASLNSIYCTGNYTITGSLTNKLQFTGSDPFIGVTSGNTLTLPGDITCTPTLVKNGAGTLTMSGSNTLTGGLTLESGIASITSGSIGAGTFTVGKTGSAVYTEIKTPSTQTITNALTILQDFTASPSTGLSWNSAWSLPASASTTITVSSGSTFGSNTVPTGTGSTIVKQGAGILSFTNSIAGTLPTVETRAGTYYWSGSASNTAPMNIYAGTVGVSAGTPSSSGAVNIYGSFSHAGFPTYTGNWTVNNSSTMTLSSGTPNVQNLTIVGDTTIFTGNINNIYGTTTGYGYSGATAFSTNVGFTNLFVTSNLTHFNSKSVGTLTVDSVYNVSSANITLGNNNWNLAGGIVSSSGNIIASGTAVVEVSGTCSGTGATSFSGTTFKYSTNLAFPTLTLGNATHRLNLANVFLNSAVTLGGSAGQSLNNVTGSTLDISGKYNSLTLASSWTFTNTNKLIIGNLAISASGNQTISGAGLEISGTISGSFYFQKVGTGTLTLSGDNSGWAGAIQYAYLHQAGTTILANANALGTKTLYFDSATGNFDVTSALTFTNGITFQGTSVTFTGTYDAVFSGASVMGATTALTISANTLSLNGALTGTATITKTGTGTLALGGANNMTGGGFTVNSGTLKITNANAIKQTITIGSLGTLDLSNLTAPVTTSSASALVASTATGTIKFSLVGTGATTLAVAGNINLSNCSIVLVGTPSGSTTFNLITYTGTLTGTPTLTTTTLNGHTVSLNNTAGIIRVTTGA
jgi:autotransporter-associated beta strand protein